MDNQRRALLQGRIRPANPLGGNIASLVVRAKPERLAALRAAIEAIPAAEVHAVTNDGRMIVTVEDCRQLSASEALIRVQQLDHVICVTLAYEHCEHEHCESALQEMPS